MDARNLRPRQVRREHRRWTALRLAALAWLGACSWPTLAQGPWAAQMEVRHHLWGRFGVVFFGGVGGIAPNIGDLGDTKFLPAVGTGLRYQASKSTGINLRVDMAIGKDSNALYVGIGEAF